MTDHYSQVQRASRAKTIGLELVQVLAGAYLYNRRGLLVASMMNSNELRQN
jgi:hypothetical protein